MKYRKVVIWAIQVALAALIGVFVWRALSDQWAEFQSLEFDMALRPVPLFGAVVVVLAVYALLIVAWRGVLLGWKERLPFVDAVHIWSVSNLGRYVPGKVWSVAGLAVLAQRRGIRPWASVGSAIAMQALSLGSGIAVVAFVTPRAAPALQLGVGAIVIAGVLAVLVSPALGRRLVAMLNRPDLEFHALPIPVVAGGLAATGAAWMGYGVAFSLLLEGLVPDVQIPLLLAIGVFAAGYIAGFLTLFAPGGLGVREAVYIALLTPSIGGGAAIAVAVASRILLTITEVIAALVGLTLARNANERPAI